MASSAMDDHGENTSLMAPLLIGNDSRHRTDLTDLSVELASNQPDCGGAFRNGVLSFRDSRRSALIRQRQQSTVTSDYILIIGEPAWPAPQDA